MSVSNLYDPTDFSEYTGGAGAGAKSTRFIPRSVDRVPYIPPGSTSGFPKNSGHVVFEDQAGRAMCWRIGQQTAAEFVKGRHGLLKGANDQLFHKGRVKVFFPIVDRSHDNGAYYACKSLTIKANPTLERVLDTVQTCAYHAVADHLIKDRISSTTTPASKVKVTLGEIREALSSTVSCHLVCSRAGGWNHVYVRIS